MDVDAKIADLEGMIHKYRIQQMDLSKKIQDLMNERRAIFELPEHISDSQQLKRIDDALSHFMDVEKWLIVQHDTLPAEMIKLRHHKEQVHAPVPAKGIKI